MIFLTWLFIILWLLIKERISATYVFGVSLIFFYGTGFITTQQLLANIVNESIVTLLLLIIVTLPLAKNIWLSFVIKKICMQGERKALSGLLVFTTFVSAFINNTAVIAMLLQQIAQQKKLVPSRILLPLSYAAMLGGTLTLIGTSTNLLINGLIVSAGYEPLSFFAFTQVGLPAVIILLIVIYWQAKKLPINKRLFCEDSQYLFQAIVPPLSPLCGKRVADCGLRSMDGVFLMQVLQENGNSYAVSAHTTMQAGDKLLFTGNPEKIYQLHNIKGLMVCNERDNECFADKDKKLYKVVVRPQADIIGSTLKESNFRQRFNAAVVAIRQRSGEYSGGEQQLALSAGDVLVVAGEEDFTTGEQTKNDFFIFDNISLNNSLFGWRALCLLLSFVGILLLATLGVLSLLKGMLLFLAGLLVTKSLSFNEIKENFPIEIMIIMVAALCFADLLADSVVTQQVIDWLQLHFHQYNGLMIILFLYCTTLLLTQIVTNHAAAALMTPLALQFAEGMSVSIMPLVMAVAFAASAAFISPFAYQTHLMIFNVGSYKVNDFISFGWRIVVIYSCMILLAILLIY